jgi:hypothetical protein
MIAETGSASGPRFAGAFNEPRFTDGPRHFDFIDHAIFLILARTSGKICLSRAILALSVIERHLKK